MSYAPPCRSDPQTSWSENPTTRPSFREIVGKLTGMERAVQVSHHTSTAAAVGVVKQ